MCHKKQWMLWIQNHIWKPLPGPQRQSQDAAPSQANWKWTMTLDFLLKFIGFTTWLCFSKGHFEHRKPSARSRCQNLSLSCLAAHIETVTEFQGPGQDPPDRMKGFSSGQWHHDQTSLMAAQLMGNVERQGPEGAQMLAEVMPTIYLGEKNSKPNVTSKVLLKSLPLETPFLG